MSRIRASYKREADAIRDSRSYSVQGRNLELAKVYRTHRQKAAALRAQHAGEIKSRRDELQKRLFGIPSGGSDLSYRDALDRVDDIRSEEKAEELLTRALRTGDAILAKVVAGHAFSKGWNKVTSSYVEDAGLTNSFEELSELPRGAMNGIGEAALFGLLPPDEIGHLRSDGALEEFITRAENADATPTLNGRQFDPTGSSAFTR
jgi:hypothetical protein